MLLRAASLLLCLAVTPLGPTPQRPDVSGIWMATADVPPGLPPAPSALLGARLGLALSGNQLTVTRLVGSASATVTLTLDGSRSAYRVPGRLCEGDREIVETATWEGNAIALVGVGQTPPGGGPSNVSNVRRLITLVAPDTLVVQGTFVANGQPTAVGAVYKRTTQPMPAAVPAFSGTPATIANLAWLPGFWVTAGGTTTVEERWTPAASGGSIGVSRTLRGAALSGFEFLCIVERNGTLVYAAMPDARMPPTYFTLSALSADSATFENPTHDYPTRIRYTKRPDGSLETTISGPQNARPQTVVLLRKE